MVQFNFSFQPGVSFQQMIGFEIAGRIWGSYLTDDATVNIHVGTADLPGKMIGGALPGILAQAKYQDFRSALRADSKSWDDWRTNRSFQGSSHGGNTTWFGTASMGDIGLGRTYKFRSNQLNLTRANAKALGMIAANTAPALDGHILLNTLTHSTTASGLPVTWNYDFTQQSSAPDNSLDFLSTAIHEIGHVLGFTSGIDAPGWLNPLVALTDPIHYQNSLRERAQNATPLDFLRYSHKTDLANAADLSIGGTGDYFLSKFLSLDGGNTAIEHFATGADTSLKGDGFQASHWQAGTDAIMAPTLRTGQRSSIADVDLRAFDAIGWDLSPTGIHTFINLSALQSQAKQALADRLGTTVTWLDANTDLASQQLSSDRTLDVVAMITDSAIYNRTRSKGSTSPLEIAQILAAHGLFDTLDEGETLTAKPSISSKNGIVKGTANSDTLTGGTRADQLVGMGGSDILSGGLGWDKLRGGQGQDLLSGGRGRNILIGNAGNDLFVVDLDAGLNIVRDFTDGEDKLVLAEDLKFDQLHIGQTGKDTLISQGDNSLMLLKNVDASLVTAADFI